jgi:hypothetical protein
MLLRRRTGNPDVGRQVKKLREQPSAEVQTHLVFDRDRFEANTMHDVSLQREILGLFLAQLDQMRARLVEGPVSIEDSRFLGHTLRGAAAAVGAVEFEAIGLNWEKLALSGEDLITVLESSEVSYRKAISPYRV